MAARLFWKREDGTTGTMTGGNEDDDDDDHLFFCPTEVYSSQGNNNGGIVWQNVAFETSQQHIILEPFSFQVANGRLCAILGPSGAGKTTLLKSLAGASQHQGQVFLYNNNHNMDKATDEYDDDNDNDNAVILSPLSKYSNHQIAWLQQQDNFFEMLTVKETLELAAFLELPGVSYLQRNEMISSLMDGLGLHYEFGNETCRPTHILSGGERRRLSVALELLSSEEVKVLLADEPTSGLDASRSEKVLRLIRNLATNRNIPCLVTLHQPRSSIWNNLLDDCILMAQGGRVCYAGSTDTCLSYFAELGFKCPPATNPAEFLIDLVSIDTEDPEQAQEDRQRIDKLATAFRKHQLREWQRQKKLLMKQDKVIVRKEYQHSHVLSDRFVRGPFHWIPRFAALVRRSWRQNIRNYAVNGFRLVASIGNAALLAQIFPSVRGSVPTANSVADRVALLSFGAINMCMLACMKTVELFGKEKPVVQREQRRSQYSSLEYLLAKGLAELPLDIGFACVFTTVLKWTSGVRISWQRLTSVFSLITASGASLGFLLGSWAPTAQLAQQGGIPLLVILMVVGIINPSGVDPAETKPWILRMLKSVSPFAYCIEALCLGEYPGMEFARKGLFGRISNLPRMGGLAFVKNGDQVIEALGLDGKTFEEAMTQLALLTAANFVMSWLGLMSYEHHERLPKVTPSKKPRKQSNSNRLDPTRVPARAHI